MALYHFEIFSPLFGSIFVKVSVELVVISSKIVIANLIYGHYELSFTKDRFTCFQTEILMTSRGFWSNADSSNTSSQFLIYATILSDAHESSSRQSFGYEGFIEAFCRALCPFYQTPCIVYHFPTILMSIPWNVNSMFKFHGIAVFLLMMFIEMILSPPPIENMP